MHKDFIYLLVSLSQLPYVYMCSMTQAQNIVGAEDRRFVTWTRTTGLYIIHSKKKHQGQRDPEKSPLGPSSIPGQRWPCRKSVNLTLNMTQSWVNLTLLFCQVRRKLANSGSLLTRNGVWSQWTLFRVTLNRLCLECRSLRTRTVHRVTYMCNSMGLSRICTHRSKVVDFSVEEVMHQWK